LQITAAYAAYIGLGFARPLLVATRMGLIDSPTLALIIAAGIQLGLLGFFGWDAAAAIFGSYAKLVYMVIGASRYLAAFPATFPLI
jgi:uncharacterized membrane protein YuzA (DUF378 family)